MNPWTPFWFESNQYFNWIRSQEDWNNLCDCYPDKSNDWLLSALSTDDTKPNFGFRMEHRGDKTLKQFFRENGMVLEPRKLKVQRPHESFLRDLINVWNRSPKGCIEWALWYYDKYQLAEVLEMAREYQENNPVEYFNSDYTKEYAARLLGIE